MNPTKARIKKLTGEDMYDREKPVQLGEFVRSFVKQKTPRLKSPEDSPLARKKSIQLFNRLYEDSSRLREKRENLVEQGITQRELNEDEVMTNKPYISENSKLVYNSINSQQVSVFKRLLLDDKKLQRLDGNKSNQKITNKSTLLPQRKRQKSN